MKSTKLLKQFSLGLILVLMLCTMTGCLSQFDASRYATACLDLITKGETKDYIEMTKQTKEEAEEWYNSFLDEEVNSMTASISNMTDEQTQNFRSLFENIYKKAKYEVGEATKNDDKSFTVPITVYKYKIFEGELKIVQDKLTDYYTEQAKNGKTLTEDEITSLAVDYLYEDLNAKLETAEYEEAEVINIAITPDSNNVYSISQSDYKNILYKLFDISDFQN